MNEKQERNRRINRRILKVFVGVLVVLAGFVLFDAVGGWAGVASRSHSSA